MRLQDRFGNRSGQHAGWLKRRVELRICVKAKLLNHLFRDGPRSDHLELTEKTLFVRHDIAEHRFELGDFLLAVLDDQIRLRGVERRQGIHAEHGDRHQHRDNAGEQVLASPEGTKGLGQVELASCHPEEGGRLVLTDCRMLGDVVHDLARCC